MTPADVLGWLLQLIDEARPPQTLAHYERRVEVSGDELAGDRAIEISFESGATFRIRVEEVG